MIDTNALLTYYPAAIAENKSLHKHVLKEYVELLALEHLSQSPYADRLVFIGGTCLRLVYGIDRFSEDLDFDCKNLSHDEFIVMTDDLVRYLGANGMQVETRDAGGAKLVAYRRNIYFPELLFHLHLTGHKEERFLMKVEAQDQGVPYRPTTAVVSRNGFLFPITVPPKEVLLSMKLSALLTRAKGRDFYDTVFLWQQAEPDFHFLSQRCGIGNMEELWKALEKKLETINLADKQRDFEHLILASSRKINIAYFKEFMRSKL